MPGAGPAGPVEVRLHEIIRRRPAWLLVGFCLLLYLPGLGNRDLWNPDEPRYAEVTREMLANGEIFVPHLNGRVYTHKPPVMFWAMGLASLLAGGLTEAAVRLPSAAAAIGTVLLTWSLGRRLFDPVAGFVAALALATSTKILWQSRTGQIDMLLTFFVTLTAYLWVRALLEARPRLYLLGFLVTGVGTVTKGPVALLPILLSFLVYLWIDGRRGEIRLMRIGRGLLLWLAVVLAWLVPATIQAGPAYFEELVVTQNLTRATSGVEYAGTRGHVEPAYYYLALIPLEFLPWTLLLPAAAIGFRRGADARRRSSAKLALCWALVTIVFFSVPEAKRSVYVLQMYPALALLVGGGLSLLSRGERLRSRWLYWPLGVLAAVLSLIAGAMAWAGPARPEMALLPSALPFQLTAVLLAIAGSAAVAAWFTSRRKILVATGTLATGFGLSVLVVFWALLPIVNPLKSVRAVAERYVEVARPGDEWASFPELEPALLFYTRSFGRVLRSEDQLREYLSENRRRFLFAERDDLRRIGETLPAEEVTRGVDPTNGYVLFLLRGSGNSPGLVDRGAPPGSDDARN